MSVLFNFYLLTVLGANVHEVNSVVEIVAVFVANALHAVYFAHYERTVAAA